MKSNAPLTITSLLSILFMTLHVSDDIAHGFEPGGLTSLGITVPVLVVWLYGTLVLAERRSGYVIVLIGSLLGAIVPVIHMKGEGVGKIATSSGGFFFVFTLMALGVTAVFSVILSVRGLWSLRRGGSS
jgi:biotin transporter BioY